MTEDRPVGTTVTVRPPPTERVVIRHCLPLVSPSYDPTLLKDIASRGAEANLSLAIAVGVSAAEELHYEKLSAEGGSPGGQISYALSLLEKDNRSPATEPEAWRFMTLAAETGDFYAISMLIDCFEGKECSTQRLDLALTWCLIHRALDSKAEACDAELRQRLSETQAKRAEQSATELLVKIRARQKELKNAGASVTCDE